MLPVQVPVGLSLILALGAGSAAWTARLEGKDGSKVSGTAQVESTPAMPASDSANPPKDSMPAPTPAAPAELRVTVTLSNAPANASLSWYLYSGSCSDASAGAAESILGVPSTYSPVKIDGSGNGSTTVSIRGAQMESGNHYVGVHAAGGGKLAACGNLEPAKTSSDE